MPSVLVVRVSDIEPTELEPTIAEFIEGPEEVSEFFERYNELLGPIDELNSIKKDCSEPNWEGDDELPVDEETVRKTQKLLCRVAMLPIDIPLPTVSPLPSGWIEIEWYLERGKNYVIRMSGSGTFIYSGFLEKYINEKGQEKQNETYGEDFFTDDTLPSTINNSLESLFQPQIN